MPPSAMGPPPLSLGVDPSGLPESVAPVSVVEESMLAPPSPPAPLPPLPSLPETPESFWEPVAPELPPPEHAAAITGTSARVHRCILRLYARLHRDAGGVMF